ncbi:MAG: OmpA family protein [Rickettsiales bacterium]|jgi:outer membrane protein OmpA-like peptidoglycan-associated protein|nr:OmpA family protein [Rickettsiales bacterium]
MFLGFFRAEEGHRPSLGRLVTTSALLLALAQCANNKKNAGPDGLAAEDSGLEDITATGEAMNDLLSEKYQNYSDVLGRNGDHDSSSYFKKLSKNAKAGDPGKKFRFHDTLRGSPEQMADLYFLFNCWHYFETQNKNLGEATTCKNSFQRLSHSLRIGTGKSVLEIGDSIGMDLTREEEFIFAEFMKNRSISILFDYDAYKLNPTGITKIGLLLKYLNYLNSDYRIIIIGHTDRVGKPIYNNTLARRRANGVFNILLKNGVPRSLITVQHSGSRSPRVITRRGARNQLNRRVEIIVNTDYKSQDLQPEPQIVQKNTSPGSPQEIDSRGAAELERDQSKR